ncbi:uncharacterized protein BCR38DRAFT_405628 [Pseudomassariella vexata]|uniref:Uncharacterized protein n=1 Tax=Pseudomassariella vexata TaxID=1141098 RepID=A0A1Y2EGQ9_9PEZI|nr:uncharacterized protein BCR38DRAFT_405628 [Pseudomassariella vexata]ORY69975.1 hypothetical protein BCR38DRAFT_405628 [Pseudomassariella vexata]
MLTLLSILLALAPTLPLATPAHAADINFGGVQRPATAISTVTVNPVVTVTQTTFATATTPAPTSTISYSSHTGKCDYSFCSNGNEWCFWYAGVTGWNPSQGAVPGETHAIIGPCTA